MAEAAKAPSLGSLEAKIMRVAWDHPDRFLPVRQMLALLDDDLAYTTVMTVMNRLFEKGLLRRRRVGRAWSYRPTGSREAYIAATMSEALNAAEDRTAALLHFLADLGPHEAAALRRLLDATDGT
ncbi:MAG: BlaI/MecI/CopY family transcriptional regulator [Actinomycetota bacterium]|nr:BlaI/MecI/CopY family transcriptional regulator [Actinomycetota bacterium]